LIFNIGYTSNGLQAKKDLLSTSHLFVSYINTEQIKSFLSRLLQHNATGITQCMFISKKDNLISLPDSILFSNYVYDNPEKGTIQYRNKLFTKVFQLLKKRKLQKKPSTNLVLVYVDDIWQLVPKLDKRNSLWLKELLMDGAAFHIFFIIGSTLPYRNLLLQLMQPNISKHSPMNKIGAEMIINPDDLLFFREKNQLNFDSFYPQAPVTLLENK
jgi:hypothetical protein